MTPALFEPQLPHFKTLADVWLASGASAFGVWAENIPLVSWPPNADLRASTLTAEISVNSTRVAELRVAGLNTLQAKARLEADAQLISHLLPLEIDVHSLAAELLDTRDRLVAIYDLTHSTRNCADGNQILGHLTSEAARLLNAENAFLRADLPDGEALFAAHLSKPVLDKRLLMRCLRGINGNGYSSIHSGNRRMKIHGIRNILLIPIPSCRAGDAAIGFINTSAPDLTSSDIKLAKAIADYAGAQIENLVMNRENLELARLQTEMELAQRVQFRLLPKVAPNVAGLDYWAISHPALHVGGDFYDFIARNGQPFTFVVGDISGKGMSAALMMSMTRTAIRTHASAAGRTTPECILNSTNAELYDDFSGQSMFATLFVGQYDPEKRVLLYANAGHSPVIYFRPGREALLMEADSTPVGIMSVGESRNHSLRMQPGDILFIGTDGLSEASNKEGKMYGHTRLLQNIKALAGMPARTIVESLYRSVRDFSSGRLQEDDQTLIVLKCIA